MENLNLDNLDNELISFDLSPEDMEAIKGGTSVPVDISTDRKCRFPIVNKPFPIVNKPPHIIIIVARPPAETT
ncbi:hypothetical protein [Nostoc sp.]|uniref:hypothetical protein n=1 Tax=Nostoc sp. TaxID=1180 RepID=UPI002FF7B7E8